MEQDNKTVGVAFREQIDSAKIKLLYKNLYVSVPVNFLSAAVVFFSLYTSFNESVSLTWFVAVIFVSLYRLFAFYFYYMYPNNNKLLLYYFISGTILSAALWGVCASYLMPPDSLLEQTIIIVIIAGVTAGGLQMLQASFVVNALYLLTVMFPACVWLYIQDGLSYFILGISMTSYLVFTLITALRGYKAVEQSLKLFFENIALIEDLSASNKKLTHAYHTIEDNELRLRDIQENAPIGMAVISLEGTWLEINSALCEILGYSKIELKAKSLEEITDAVNYTETLNNREKMIQGQINHVQNERQFVHKHGQLIWVLINESLVRDSQKKPLYFISQIQDINERKHNDLIVKELNEKTHSMLTQLQQRELEMGFINKMNVTLQTCQESSEAYSIINNMAEQLFFQLSGGLMIADQSAHCLETMSQWGSQQILKKNITHNDCWALRTGHMYVVDHLGKDLVCHHFDTPPQSGYICVPQISQTGIVGLLVLIAPTGDIISSHQQQLASSFNDVIKLSLTNIRLLEMLNEQSIHDALTQLYNRRFLDETLPRELARIARENRPLCVCMLDIDYFKQFNDTNGHEAGDEVLKLIGQVLLDNTRKTDIVCRLGGEEFVLVFVDSHVDEVFPKLANICELIRGAHIQFRGQLLPQITVSVGIAEAPKQGTLYKDILRAADDALYSAKQNGRDRIEINGNLLP